MCVRVCSLDPMSPLVPALSQGSRAKECHPRGNRGARAEGGAAEGHLQDLWLTKDNGKNTPERTRLWVKSWAEPCRKI